MGEGVRLHPRLEAMDEGRPYRRIEVITGRRRRRSYAAEEKARIVAESAVPGANISEVARRNGVNCGLLTVWRREAGVIPDAAPVETPLFVPVTVAEEPTPAPPEHRCPSAPGQYIIGTQIYGRAPYLGSIAWRWAAMRRETVASLML